MKRNRTKKSLLLSVMSLLLCVSMFAGSTYAWFTDEVTSGVNQIIAGNLDVELYHSNDKTVPTIVDANKVTSTTKLFTDGLSGDRLWEPGAISVENFTVKNVGNLALKYEFDFSNFTYNYVYWGGNDSTKYDLRDVIKVAIVEGGFTGDRTAAQALTYSSLSTLDSRTAALEPGASETFGIVLYWQPNDKSVDNLYNLKNGAYDATANPTGWTLSAQHSGNDELYIEAGVTLIASQYTSESDSFDNQYDANATPVITITSVRATETTVAGQPTVIEAGSVGNNLVATKATISADAIPADKDVTLVVEESQDSDAVTTILSENGTPLYFEVKLEDETGAEVELAANGYVDVEENIGKNLVINQVNHRTTTLTTTPNTNGEYYAYDVTTGILRLHLTSLSPFSLGYDAAEVRIGTVGYKTFDEGYAAAEAGDTISLLKDLTINNGSDTDRKDISKSLTIDGEKHTVTINGRGFGVGMSASSNIDVTFENISIYNTLSYGRCIDTRGHINSLNLNNVVLETKAPATSYNQPLTIGGNQTDVATVNIKNSTIQTNGDAVAYYAITTFNPVNMTIEDSTIRGWACIYAKAPNSSAGSEGSVFTIKNSNLVSNNTYNGVTNAFAMFVAEDEDITFNVQGSHLVVKANSDQYQAVLTADSDDVVVNVDSKTNIELIGDNAVEKYNSGTVNHVD